MNAIYAYYMRIKKFYLMIYRERKELGALLMGEL